MITIEDFKKIDIRTGTIIEAKENIKAIKPAYILTIDFGEEIGLKQSSAQLTQNYSKDDLVGMQIIAVINFHPMRIAGIKSEVLVLGSVCQENGVVLLTPTKKVLNGQFIG